MQRIKTGPIRLIGIKHPGKTSNANGQSSIDCGSLWSKFAQEDIGSKISGKLDDDVYAVYFDYEGDHTQPFGYFIGCAVRSDITTPDGLDTLTIPAGYYLQVTAKGKMPDCIANAWKDIWESQNPRSYNFDFEVYGKKSKDWNNAEVNIYLS